MAAGLRPLYPVVLFSLFCAAILWLLFYFMVWPLTRHYIVVLAFFFVLTSALHLWQERGLQHDPKGSVRRFMAALVFKMLVSLGAIVLLILRTEGTDRVRLILVFVFLYLAFLTFSTVRMLGLSNRKGNE